MMISIVTATKNRKLLLGENMESVRRSVLAPRRDVSFEHVIYDDGSTDGTELLFEEGYAKSSCKYIKGDKSRGVSYAKNQAVAHSSGEYVFVLDDDDVILQRTIYNFAECLESGASWYLADFLRADNDLKYMMGEDYYSWKFSTTSEMLESIYKGEHFLQGNVMFSRKIFDKVGGFDEKMGMAEDLDLYVRFLREGEMPDAVCFISHIHRMHTFNLSAQTSKEDHVKIAQELRKKYKN
ncbi:MAG: hypothetical protein A3G52_01925 [Candidatus Taylorbacteria bacterium RIFCSPLOWO2_12_FULL_43_20]|uniref:Glycosyltransferase 2-like domain-containing protein n=1 Tax=Candidatus Taylorbacteria bacterium RIFCSPLOWO2_12_FULL_43_20 TaxID=1802332 RepID=A0A1G2P3Q7_9BACT|nr:MAG: hypothetical protein A2825_02860 [Candidatus Taylorbacteria bacterium RIFCSPHIGHO2_01_FULL_43_120]OHA23010.1 MAG: hypothetical protein A3B98_01895 [Candidatus Taylorbacteria bacterium RIFCSPHIGHO2_02_FULL_43_55]OHA30724.1 MAG: hypothetical protein A3B09_01685 [Candidatus Taylorbacteria bacterium RIFCSPLOWO2_01_FULL_43_83]OHA42978.1 MAG: hypothetical protein A3G52_01925 [Candidatus Taylorbacteria bacterium RIFCSPLOWO2_12_FULL_43_20]